MCIFASYPYIAWCAITESQCTIAPQPYPTTGTDFIFLQQNRKRASVSYAYPRWSPRLLRQRILHLMFHTLAPLQRADMCFIVIFQSLPHEDVVNHTFFLSLVHTRTHTPACTRKPASGFCSCCALYYPSVRLSGDHVSGRMNGEPTFRRS